MAEATLTTSPTSSHPAGPSTSPAPAPPERAPIGAFIFMSRWLQVPLYLGLIVAQAFYVWQFMKELWHLGVGLFTGHVHATAEQLAEDPTADQFTSGDMIIAVLGLVLHRRTLYHLSLLGVGVSTGSPAYRDTARTWYERAHELGLSHADSLRAAKAVIVGHISKTASVLGFQDAFLIGALLTFVVLFGVFLLPNRPIHNASSEPIHME